MPLEGHQRNVDVSLLYISNTYRHTQAMNPHIQKSKHRHVVPILIRYVPIKQLAGH